LKSADGVRTFLYRDFLIQLKINGPFLDCAVISPDQKDVQKVCFAYKAGRFPKPTYVARRLKGTVLKLREVRAKRAKKYAERRTP
jgi:hypothetical protein